MYFFSGLLSPDWTFFPFHGLDLRYFSLQLSPLPLPSTLCLPGDLPFQFLRFWLKDCFFRGHIPDIIPPSKARKFPSYILHGTMTYIFPAQWSLGAQTFLPCTLGLGGSAPLCTWYHYIHFASSTQTSPQWHLQFSRVGITYSLSFQGLSRLLFRPVWYQWKLWTPSHN